MDRPSYRDRGDIPWQPPHLRNSGGAGEQRRGRVPARPSAFTRGAVLQGHPWAASRRGRRQAWGVVASAPVQAIGGRGPNGAGVGGQQLRRRLSRRVWRAASGGVRSHFARRRQAVPGAFHGADASLHALTRGAVHLAEAAASRITPLTESLSL